MIISNNVQKSKPKGLRSGTLYRCSGGLLIVKTTQRGHSPNLFRGVRAGIVQFSAGAGVRMRRYLRECLAVYVNMVTLTYPGFYESDGAIVKEHLRRFIQELKRYSERHAKDEGTRFDYSVFWFLEFQERGAPHFHLFTTHNYPHEWVAKTWYRIVDSEDERHLHAGTRIEALRSGKGGTISYATKYAVKQQQKVVPIEYDNVGRFWGVSGARATLSADTWVDAWQRSDPGVQTVLKTIKSVAESSVAAGGMSTYKRDVGVYIGSISDNDTERKLRMRICQLSALTGFRSQVFSDAGLNIEDDICRN